MLRETCSAQSPAGTKAVRCDECGCILTTGTRYRCRDCPYFLCVPCYQVSLQWRSQLYNSSGCHHHPHKPTLTMQRRRTSSVNSRAPTCRRSESPIVLYSDIIRSPTPTQRQASAPTYRRTPSPMRGGGGTYLMATHSPTYGASTGNTLLVPSATTGLRAVPMVSSSSSIANAAVAAAAAAAASTPSQPAVVATSTSQYTNTRISTTTTTRSPSPAPPTYRHPSPTPFIPLTGYGNTTTLPTSCSSSSTSSIRRSPIPVVSRSNSLYTVDSAVGGGYTQAHAYFSDTKSAVVGTAPTTPVLSPTPNCRLTPTTVSRVTHYTVLVDVTDSEDSEDEYAYITEKRRKTTARSGEEGGYISPSLHTTSHPTRATTHSYATSSHSHSHTTSVMKASNTPPPPRLKDATTTTTTAPIHWHEGGIPVQRVIERVMPGTPRNGANATAAAEFRQHIPLQPNPATRGGMGTGVGAGTVIHNNTTYYLNHEVTLNQPTEVSTQKYLSTTQTQTLSDATNADNDQSLLATSSVVSTSGHEIPEKPPAMIGSTGSSSSHSSPTISHTSKSTDSNSINSIDIHQESAGVAGTWERQQFESTVSDASPRVNEKTFEATHRERLEAINHITEEIQRQQEEVEHQFHECVERSSSSSGSSSSSSSSPGSGSGAAPHTATTGTTATGDSTVKAQPESPHSSPMQNTIEVDGSLGNLDDNDVYTSTTGTQVSIQKDATSHSGTEGGEIPKRQSDQNGATTPTNTVAIENILHSRLGNGSNGHADQSNGQPDVPVESSISLSPESATTNSCLSPLSLVRCQAEYTKRVTTYDVAYDMHGSTRSSSHASQPPLSSITSDPLSPITASALGEVKVGLDRFDKIDMFEHFLSQRDRESRTSTGASPSASVIANSAGTGNLKVRLVAGTQLFREGFKGDRNPYVELAVGDQSHASTIGWGKSEPTWNEDFLFGVDTFRTIQGTATQQNLSVQVFNKQLGTIKGEFLGQTVVSLNKLRRARKKEVTLNLGHNGNGVVTMFLDPIDFGRDASTVSQAELNGTSTSVDGYIMPTRHLSITHSTTAPSNMRHSVDDKDGMHHQQTRRSSTHSNSNTSTHSTLPPATASVESSKGSNSNHQQPTGTISQPTTTTITTAVTTKGETVVGDDDDDDDDDDVHSTHSGPIVIGKEHQLHCDDVEQHNSNNKQHDMEVILHSPRSPLPTNNDDVGSRHSTNSHEFSVSSPSASNTSSSSSSSSSNSDGDDKDKQTPPQETTDGAPTPVHTIDNNDNHNDATQTTTTTTQLVTPSPPPPQENTEAVVVRSRSKSGSSSSSTSRVASVQSQKKSATVSSSGSNSSLRSGPGARTAARAQARAAQQQQSSQLLVQDNTTSRTTKLSKTSTRMVTTKTNVVTTHL